MVPATPEHEVYKVYTGIKPSAIKFGCSAFNVVRQINLVKLCLACGGRCRDNVWEDLAKQTAFPFCVGQLMALFLAGREPQLVA
eukprot:123115-Pelagomonas_calceolata.AAC.1